MNFKFHNEIFISKLHIQNLSDRDEEKSLEAEDDTSQDENVADIQKEKLLSINFEVKVENQKGEGLITYSTDQQIFNFKVISGSYQEVWVVYIDFQSIHSK